MLVLLLTGSTSRLFSQEARYVFLFIGDGMGFAQVQAADLWLRSQGGPGLCFTDFPVQGFVATHSASHTVTDSAAAGTALAAGVKTTNGTLGLDTAGRSVVTIAEQARLAGCRVGIATSVAVNHATPAAFYAHRSERESYYRIGLDALRAGFDLYAGAGLKEVQPSDSLGARSLYDLFSEAGYRIVRGCESLDSTVLAGERMLFVQPEETPNSSSLTPAIDRTGDGLTLPEITRTCIDFLGTATNSAPPAPFFLMVEGGIVDWLCHANDTASVVAETVDFAASVSLAADFYRRYPEHTLIVVTADHETGGLSVGKGERSTLSLDVLGRQSASVIGLTGRLKTLRRRFSETSVPWSEVRAVVCEACGFQGKHVLTLEEEELLLRHYETSFTKSDETTVQSLYYAVEPVADCALQIMSKRAGFAWGSKAHTAAPVPVYVLGAGSEYFRDLRDNTDLPRAIRRAAGYGMQTNAPVEGLE